MFGGTSSSSASSEEEQLPQHEPQKVTVSWSPDGQDPPALGLGLQLRDFPLSTAKLLDPLEVRFSQMKMRHLFGDGRRVSDAVREMHLVPASDEVKRETGADWSIVAPFPMIEVLWWRCKVRDETTGKPKIDPVTKEDLYDSEEHWFTLDNRRLYCLQEVALKVWPERAVCDVAVIVGGPHKHMRELRKFRTLDKGQSIAIGSKADQVNFVRWCWKAKAGVEDATGENDDNPELVVDGMRIERRPKADILQMLSQVEPDSDERIQLSKQLSFLLRRGPGSSGLKAEPDGWVRLENLLMAGQDDNSALSGMTLERLLTLIEESNRQKFRYEVKDDPKRGKLIRASGKKGKQPSPTPAAKADTGRSLPPGNWAPPSQTSAAPLSVTRSGLFAPPGILSSPLDLSSPPGLPTTPGAGVAAIAKVLAPNDKASPNRNPKASVIRGPVAPGVVQAPVAAATSRSGKATTVPQKSIGAVGEIGGGEEGGDNGGENGGEKKGEKGVPKAKAAPASTPGEKKASKVSSKTVRAEPKSRQQPVSSNKTIRAQPLFPPGGFGKGGLAQPFPPGMPFGVGLPPPHLAALKGKGKGLELAKLAFHLRMEETMAHMAALENLKLQASSWDMMADAYAPEDATTGPWSSGGGLAWDEQDHYDYDYDRTNFDGQAGWGDMEEWGHSVSSRMAPGEELSVEEQVRLNVEAARARNAAARDAEQAKFPRQQKQAGAKSVDPSSLESKAAEALAAARVRSSAGPLSVRSDGAAAVGGPSRPPGIAHPAVRSPPELEAKVQAALNAAKSRQASS